MAAHTNPEQLGRLLAETQLLLAVLNHVTLSDEFSALLGDHLNAYVPEAEILRRIRSIHDGAVEVGTDLMTIDVRTAAVIQRELHWK